MYKRQTVKWAFSSTAVANWHPLTWLSHALDYQLFGLNPAGHHLDSVFIHALNAMLLFLLLTRLTKRAGPSLFVAALFAVPVSYTHLLSALILAGVTVLVVIFRSRRYLPVGWFWFLGTLVPVIGLVQVGEAAMADRYAYLSLIGIFVMIAWSLADFAEAKKVPAVWRVVPALCAVTALGVVTVCLLYTSGTRRNRIGGDICWWQRCSLRD